MKKFAPTGVFVLAACSLVAYAPAFAQSAHPANVDPHGFEIAKTALTEIETPEGLRQSIAALPRELPPPGLLKGPLTMAGVISLAEIVNIGKQVWDVVKANEPVLNVSSDFASALPKGVVDATELAGFSDIQTKSYRYSGSNYFGQNVFDVTYTLVHQHGGSLDGKGHYLTNVAVVPTHVHVLWGYTMNVRVTKVGVSNLGSAKEPVASLLLELGMDVSTVLKKSQERNVFSFRGDSAAVRAVR